MRIFALLMILIIAFGCKPAAYKDISLDEITGNAVAKGSNDGSLVSAGDLVKVKYVGKTSDGKVFDTNIESIAVENKLENLHTDLLEFTVGKGEMIPGFDKGVLGMKIGDKKILKIPAKDAYGEYDETKVQEFPKTSELNRSETVKRKVTVDVETFKSVFGVDPEAKKRYSTPSVPFEYSVDSIRDEGISLSIATEVGKRITIPGAEWESEIVSVDDESIVVKHNPTDGQEITSLFGKAKIKVTEDKLIIEEDPEVGSQIMTMIGAATVKDVKDDKIFIDFNHELAGKELTFDVELVEMQKKVTKKVEKAKVDMYVMSFCPYGTQAEEGLGPVEAALGDSVDIVPHFVVYGSEYYQGQEAAYCIEGLCSMHGIPELEEDMRQACVWRDSKDKWWDYVNCVNEDCSLADIATCWEGCAKEAGLDSSRISKCREEDGISLMQAEKSLCEANAVEGSPTIFLNGEAYEGGRTQEDYKKEICGTLNNPPKGCGMTLDSSANPAEGSCS